MEVFMDKLATDFVNGTLRPFADRYSQMFDHLCGIIRQIDTQEIETLLGTDDSVEISPDSRPLATVGKVKEMITVMRAVKVANEANDGDWWKAFMALAVNPRI
jgi:hypothetical protein